MTDTSTKGPKKKLLWIEDDALLCTVISKELAVSEFDFILANNGEEALSLLRGMVPDLVMVDLILPGKVDGFAVLEEMSKDPRLSDIPKIVLSNLSKPADMERARKLGAAKFMVKAEMSLESILEEIRRQIRH